jgi:ADP-heptose:LPS heptosyltransferase
VRAGGDVLALSTRLVVLRALGVGDLLTAVPALRALARAFPDHERLLAAPRALEPLVELIGAGFVVADTAERSPLPTACSRAEVTVNLHGRGPQSHRLLVATRPGRLIAFRAPSVPETAGLPEWRAGEHEVARWCRLLRQCGIPADENELYLQAPAPVPEARGATVIHPGAASAARRWPPERFAAVARSEHDRGRSVLVTGAPGEEPLARRVASLAGLPAWSVLAGRTGLAELAAVIAAAGRVVCGDTGVAHLATALGTPSVVLFGPTSPAEWGPPPDRPCHQVLWTGRTGDPHARAPDPGLLEIEPRHVLAALEHRRGGG